MIKDEVVSNFLLELRRGTVILCVLSELKESTYGYNLIEKLKSAGITVEANTIYPLLRRMENQGLLESLWDTARTKPRKYYKTTEFGEDVCAEIKLHWKTIVQNVNSFLED